MSTFLHRFNFLSFSVIADLSSDLDPTYHKVRHLSHRKESVLINYHKKDKCTYLKDAESPFEQDLKVPKLGSYISHFQIQNFTKR